MGERKQKVNPSCPELGCPGKAEPGARARGVVSTPRAYHHGSPEAHQALPSFSHSPSHPGLPGTRCVSGGGEVGGKETSLSGFLGFCHPSSSSLPSRSEKPLLSLRQSHAEPLPLPASLRQDHIADSSPFPNLSLLFSTVRWRHRGGRIYLGQRLQPAQEPWWT